MEDVALTFDPTMFTKGIDSINSGIETMNKNFSQFQNESNKAQQQVKLSTMNIMGVMAKAGAMIGLIRSSLRQIPEISKTFETAGSIFMENFLWPLRKEMIPALQKVLEWVNNNRAMFVRWGTVVANVFKHALELVVQFWGMLKRVGDTFMAGMERMFGKTLLNITDLANIALFKISSVIQFMMISLEPAVQFLAKMFVGAMENSVEFFKGLSEGSVNTVAELEGMLNSLTRISDSILGLTGTVGGLSGAFRILGNGMSMVLGPIIRGIGQTFDLVASSIEDLVIGIKTFNAWRKGDVKELERLKKEEARIALKYNQRTLDRLSEQMGAWGTASENIRRIKEGKENEVSNNVNRVTNNNNKKVSSDSTTTINNSITVNVEGQKNPSETGRAVKGSLQDMLREQKFRGGTR